MSFFDHKKIVNELRSFALEIAENHDVVAEIENYSDNNHRLRIRYRNRNLYINASRIEVVFEPRFNSMKISSYNFKKFSDDSTIIKRGKNRIKKFFAAIDETENRRDEAKAKYEKVKAETKAAIQAVIKKHGITNLIHEPIDFNHLGEAEFSLKYFGYDVTLLHTGDAYVYNRHSEKLNLPKMPLEKLFKVIRTIEE